MPIVCSEGLSRVEFSDSMKEMQTNWIGKSSGAEVELCDCKLITRLCLGKKIRVYTTRPDTIFGVDFMVLAPEHEWAQQLASPEQSKAVADYIAWVKSRSERDRMAEKKISGVFTGSYVQHPFDADRMLPIWISEYVLAGYGTGAIMGVPCGDERDHKFAKHFSISITNIIGDRYTGAEASHHQRRSVGQFRIFDRAAHERGH
jgi:leucyl-tRNA synthetase